MIFDGGDGGDGGDGDDDDGDVDDDAVYFQNDVSHVIDIDQVTLSRG